MSFVFIMMDSVTPLMKNVFVAFYGSVFGTFLGVMSLTASMFVLVVVVVLEDFFLSLYSPAAQAATLIETRGPGSDGQFRHSLSIHAATSVANSRGCSQCSA